MSSFSDYAGQVFVLKLGGAPIEDRMALDALLADIGTLQTAGVRVILVHGGGPQATRLTRALGLVPNIVGGRRITDPAVLEVMKMTLAGSVSVDILARCRALGIAAIGASGLAADVIYAVRRPPRVVSGCGDEPVDFGEVGDIHRVGTRMLNHLCDGGYLPVISSLSADARGQVLNINADIAASRIAIAMGASKLFLLTGAPGVLKDPDDHNSLMQTLSVSEAKRAIESGVISGGMIPKLEESFHALDAGVGAVHILGAAVKGGLLRELDAHARTGTWLHP